MKRFLQYCPVIGLTVLVAVTGSVLVLQSPQPVDAAPFEPKIEKATHEKYTEKIAGSEVSFDMVPIPGGTYLMGSPENEKGRAADEGPQHQVQIKPFWMGRGGSPGTNTASTGSNVAM